MKLNNDSCKNDFFKKLIQELNDMIAANQKEFDKKWGKAEKDKNFQKKIFTTSTTSENGINTTIITEIFENVQNGVKKGYFKEQKNL